MTTENVQLYRDANQPVDARVEDLLARMTLDEKLAQVGCVWSNVLVQDDAFDRSGGLSLADQRHVDFLLAFRRNELESPLRSQLIAVTLENEASLSIKSQVLDAIPSLLVRNGEGVRQSSARAHAAADLDSGQG